MSTCFAAFWATLGLISKAFLSKKLLLSSSKGEILTAILADEGFVLIHIIPLKL
ncbi:protein of unknown function [Ruminococcaceae bacterium BL-4]|nr:protein of unknown function [Ruminococcaceae bacterium BL-4]